MTSLRNSRSRRNAILRYLHKSGKAQVEDLADNFQTTPQTIRKDLNALADQGRVVRFHGGASLLAGTTYASYRMREQIARKQKERIGREVARLIPNNSAVLINAGTTTAEAARNLGEHTGLKVVADNIIIADNIRHFVGAEVMVPGGIVRASDGAILGESTVEFIEQFRADFAIIGCAAIASDGTLLDFDLREAAVARAIQACARNVILAADSSKFERLAPVSIGHLGRIRTLVTDHKCPPELRALCDALGTEVVIAR